MIPDIHEEPIQNLSEHGQMLSYIEVHTYPESDLCMLTVHETGRTSIDFWMTEGQVAALRDALTKVVGDEDTRCQR